MNKLLEKMLKAGSVKTASVLKDSPFFSDRDIIKTDLPILNIAFSGDVLGGLVSGITIFAGESKTFKSLASLYCMKAYLDKYPNSIAIMYDSEFGTPPAYMDQFKIDTSRVIHVPIEHVEQLKFDMVKRLNEVEKGDKIFFFVDSLGGLASKKEVSDAEDEKSVADMSRAKAIRSWFRIVTPHFSMKDIPMIVINHVYQEMGLYPKTIIPGGSAVTYAANQIFVFSKSQEKDASGEIKGWNFNINIHKSRYVRERSKVSFLVTYEKGIEKWSGLLDIAIEGNFIVKPKNGWYAPVDEKTNLPVEPSLRLANLMSQDKIWEDLLRNTRFQEFVRSEYQLTAGEIQTTDVDIEDELQDILDEA